MLMAILIVFAFSATFMSSAHGMWFSTPPLPSTKVFLTPSRIIGTTIGQVVTVYANITNVNGLATMYLGVAWSNTTVAQCSSVAQGDIMTKQLTSSQLLTGPPGTIDNTNGIVTPYTWGTTDSYSANGSGTIIAVNFTITHTGYTDVHPLGLYLGNVPGATIPVTTIDYFTTVRGGHQYITEIQSNPTQSAAVPPDNAGLYEESVTQMSPQTIDGVSNLIGNLTFAINATATDNGPFGYFNVTIPDDLMNCSSVNTNWVVGVNNGTGPIYYKLPALTVSSGVGTTIISLAANFYPVSPLNYNTTIVNIYSTSVAPIPEFASTFSATLLAPVLMLATLAAAIFIITKLSIKRKH